MSEKIAYCTMVSENRIDEIKTCVNRVRPYVDDYIVIEGGTQDGTLEWLKKRGDIRIYEHPWKDDFSMQRNHYLNHARELGVDWVAVSDTDELFTLQLCEKLKQLISDSLDGHLYNMVQIQCEAITMDYHNKNKISSQVDDYWKNLIFKLYPETHYSGNPHETLLTPGIPWMPVNVNWPLGYQHVKRQYDVYMRAIRNHFINGGGDNRGGSAWKQFRKMCGEKWGVNYWMELIELMKKKNIPLELRDWIIEHQADDGWNGASELREHFVWYFGYIAPEERPVLSEITNKDVEWDKFEGIPIEECPYSWKS